MWPDLIIIFYDVMSYHLICLIKLGEILMLISMGWAQNPNKMSQKYAAGTRV